MARIRSGRFVTVFMGVQFALPEALHSLRAIRRGGETAEVPDDLLTSWRGAGTSARATSRVAHDRKRLTLRRGARPLGVILLHRAGIVRPVEFQLVA